MISGNLSLFKFAILKDLTQLSKIKPLFLNRSLSFGNEVFLILDFILSSISIREALLFRKRTSSRPSPFISYIWRWEVLLLNWKISMEPKPKSLWPDNDGSLWNITITNAQISKKYLFLCFCLSHYLVSFVN